MHWNKFLNPVYFLLTLNVVTVSTKHAEGSVESLGQWELGNAFREARPVWPMRGFQKLPHIWAKQVIGTAPAALKERQRLLNIRYGSEEFRVEVEKRYGLYYEPSVPNDGLPYGLTKTRANFVDDVNEGLGATAGEPGVTFNCRGCHTGVFFGTRNHGQVFSEGLSNIFMDVQRIDNDIINAAGFRSGNLFQRNLPRNTMTNAADYFGRLLTYIRTPYPRFDRFAAYQAFYARFRLPEHRHLESDIQAYLKTQSWVNIGTKWTGTHGKGLYVDGGFYDNPSSIMYGVIFSIDPSGKDFLKADQGFLQRGLPYIASLKAPKYPKLHAVSREASERGFKVYHKTCAGCHGTYQKVGEGNFSLESYPGKIIPVEKVGTDPLRAEDTGFGNVFEGGAWVRKGRIVKTNGYKAPPLNGIWARAPYLHNASVPNLRQLMKPSIRVARYAIQPKPLDPDNYDEENLGWKIKELKSAEEVEELKKADPYVRIYDPEAYPVGLTNTGHLFGAKLSDPEIDDLIVS